VTEFQLVGVVFVAFGVVLLTVMWAVRRRARSIVANGHRTEATVLSQTYVSGESGSAWRIEVAYRDFRGTSHTKKIDGPKRLDEETVTVIYDTRKPNRVVVESASWHSDRLVTAIAVIVPGAMIIVGVVFIASAWGERL